MNRSVFLFLGLFWLLPQVYFAQDLAVIDSLVKIVNSDVHDTIRANELNELAWEWRKYNRDTALNYAQQARNISKKANYNKGESTALTRIGQINEYHGKMDEALIAYQSAYEIDSLASYAFGMARATSQIASIYMQRGDYVNSNSYGEKSISSFKKIKNHQALVSTYLKTGYGYAKLGEEKNALEKYDLALSLADSVGDQVGVSNALTFKGILFEDQGRYRQSLDVYLRSLQIQKRLENKQGINTAYSNIGNLYYQLGELDSSLYYYSIILQQDTILLSDHQRGNFFHSVARVYFEKGDIEKASIYSNKSYELKRDSKDKAGLSKALCLQGMIKFKKGDFEGANFALENSLNLAKEVKDIKLIEDICSEIADTYIEYSDYERAYKYLNQAYELRDSISVKQNLSFEFESIQQQLKILQGKYDLELAENTKKNITIISIISGIVLLIIIFLLYLQSYRRRKNLIISNQNEQISRQKIDNLMNELSMKQISAMLEGQDKERERIARELHDELGGLLSLVRGGFQTLSKKLNEVSQEEKELFDHTSETLKKASERVRDFSHDIGNIQLVNQGLEAALKELKYSVEIGNDLVIDLNFFGIEQRLPNEVEFAIYRSVQELITNILKHAQADHVTIQLLQDGDDLVLTVEDNGKGFNLNKIKEGMGTKNITSRINAIGGTFKLDSGEGKGTIAIATMPLIDRLK